MEPAAASPQPPADTAALLAALQAEPQPHELALEAETVAAMAAVVRSAGKAPTTRRRPLMQVTVPRARLVLALMAATTVAALGAASAGALPAAAEAASSVLSKLGITLPDRADNAPASPAETGQPAESGQPAETGQPADTKGATISDLARTTEAEGVEKGAAISTAASEGKSRAGTQGGTAPVDTPNAGGTGTANAASGGASADGTAIADEKSGGASAAGSANADDAAAGTPGEEPAATGQAHRP